MDLDEELRGLYALALRMPRADRDELAFAAGGDRDRVADGLRRLAALGLVSEVDGRVEAVPPGAGLGRLLREGLSGASRRLAEVERLLAQLEPLDREHAAGQRSGGDAPAVRLVSGVDQAWEMPISVVLADPPMHSYCCQRDPRAFDTAVLPWIDELLQASRDGLVVMSLLVEAAVLDSPPAAASLARFVDAGMRVGSAPSCPAATTWWGRSTRPCRCAGATIWPRRRTSSTWSGRRCWWGR